MSERCEPPTELRGVDGWHWIKLVDGRPLASFWHAQLERRCHGCWSYLNGWRDADTAAGMDGWEYDGPAATPAEVEALRADRDRIIAEAKDCAKTLAAYVRDLAVISGHTRRLGEENYTLRARVAELEKVVALYQAEVGAFTGRGTTLARLMEIDGLARAALSPATEAAPE